jgi:hypothetical protein
MEDHSVHATTAPSPYLFDGEGWGGVLILSSIHSPMP